MGWSEGLLGYGARRNDAEWSFHSKGLQRGLVPRKLFNPTRSELTKRVKLTEHNKSFRITVLTDKIIGKIPDLGSSHWSHYGYLPTVCMHKFDKMDT